jgi:hypothetical protein
MATNREFNDKTERFHKETGIWPPGRDIPSATYGGDDVHEIRRLAYDYWCKQQKQLEAENAKLKQEYGEATDTIQDMIDVLRDTEKRLAKSNCPHAIAAGAWITQALED